MACPYLAYRAGAEGHTFDEKRAFCTAVGEFVQPMRADICNGRYDLAHAEDCEIYREHVEGGSRTTTDEGT